MGSRDQLETIQRAAQRDPVWFATEVLGCTLWSKQAEIMRAVWDHPRVAARSCHGIGKTFADAAIAVTFLFAWTNSRVISTAPTWPQVENLLWREINALVTRASIRCPDLGWPVPTSTKLEFGPEWFGIGLSTDRPERFQGHHAERVLLLADEASGVDDAIFEAGEGYLTTPGSRMLLTGNATQLAGQFHRAFHKEREQWHTVAVSAFDSPNFTKEGKALPESVCARLVSREWVEDKRKRWGEASPQYEVRVLGQFPSTADDTVIGLAIAEAAQKREIEPDKRTSRRLLCDVARFGSDETVIAVREGMRVRILESYVGNDLMHTTGRLVHWARTLENVADIVVDDTGLGGGVTDRLNEIQREQRASWEVVPFNGGERAVEPDEYPNRRSELWFTFAEALPGIDLDGDDQLAGDLTAPKWRMDSAGRRVVEPKKDTKKRLGRSPDRADGVMLGWAVPPARGVSSEDTTPHDHDPHEHAGGFESESAWLARMRARHEQGDNYDG